MQNYQASQLDKLASDLASQPGSWLILPENGELSVGQWKGNGYILTLGESLVTFVTVRMEISGGLLGGYGTIPAVVRAEAVADNIFWAIPKDSLVETRNTFSQEPVEMTTGAYYYEQTDLNLGLAPPLGLAFTRLYSSGRNSIKRALGFGWTHNNDIYLRQISDATPTLGGRQPIDAAATIAVAYIIQDLLENRDDLVGRMVAVLITKWVVDQLKTNVVTAYVENKVWEFAKLPDGTYASPPGSTTKLIQNSDGTFRLEERSGQRMLFDASNRITSLSDVDGNTMTYRYDTDKLSQVQDAFGRTFIVTYDGLGQITSVQDSAASRTVSYAYDDQGNLTAYTDPEGKVWRQAYEAEHRMTQLTNPLGITTVTNTYDGLGRVSTQVVPRQGGMSAVFRFYYSGFRNVEQDAYGQATVYTVDEKGRVVGIEDPLRQKASKTFDGQNHLITTTDSRGNVTTFKYDGNHNLISTTNALNHSIQNTYDALFRLTALTDPANRTITFEYDSKHHLVKTTDAEGIKSTLTYYPNGLMQTKTDGRGTPSSLTYDNIGNPLTTQTGNHPLLTYQYDAAGRIARLTDNVGTSTHFSYDKRDLPGSTVDGLGRMTSSTYDDAGQLIARTDRNNQTTTYSYTPSGSIEKINYPDGSQVLFSYDLQDRLTSMQDTTGTRSFKYDAADQLIETRSSAGGSTLGYGYDKAGNLAFVIYPNGQRVSYAYDNLNRLTTVTNWLNQIATYTYDVAGRLVSLQNFNGTKTTYVYDNANRLIALENRRSDRSAIATYQFTLDANGNRVGIVQDEPLQPSLKPRKSEFTYNAQRNRLERAASSTYQYDAEGQLFSRDTFGYQFDAAHRLVNVSGPGSSTQYSYDGEDNRVQAIRDGSATRYVYDLHGDLLAETAGDITRYYIHGLGLLAMITQGGQTYCYHYNGIGSTVALTDGNQSIVNRYAYTPFGLIADEREQFPHPFKYVGNSGVMTEPTGLYYMRARYYDPQVGRFISEDPMGVSSSDVNLYAYVGNNPVNSIDPSGLGEEKTNRLLRQIFSLEPSFALPASGRITSRYGLRPDPFTNIETFHKGIDIKGDTIRAAAAGIVKDTLTTRAGGHTLVLGHNNALTTVYIHAKEFFVGPGTKVVQGQPLGLVGRSGTRVTGPHLHFEIRENGSPKNPSRYIDIP